MQALDKIGEAGQSSHVPSKEFEIDRSRAGTLESIVRDNVHLLSVWSSQQTSMATHCPTFSSKALTLAVDHGGPAKALTAIVDEIRAQAENGLAEFALDVATTMIFVDFLSNSESLHSPRSLPRADAASDDQGLRLWDCLQYEADQTAKTILTHPQRAEVLIRLKRRVGALIIDIPAPEAQMVVPAVMEDLGLGPAVDLVAPDHSTSDLNVNVDFGPAASDLDMNLEEVLAQPPQASTDGGANVKSATDEVDIFGGLEFDFGDLT